VIADTLSAEELQDFHAASGRRLLELDEGAAKIAAVVKDEVLVEAGKMLVGLLDAAAEECGLATLVAQKLTS